MACKKNGQTEGAQKGNNHSQDQLLMGGTKGDIFIQSPKNTANLQTGFLGGFEGKGGLEQKLTRILSPIRNLNLLSSFHLLDQMFIALTTVSGHYIQP